MEMKFVMLRLGNVYLCVCSNLCNRLGSRFVFMLSRAQTNIVYKICVCIYV